MAAVEASSPWSPFCSTPDIDHDIDIDIDIDFQNQVSLLSHSCLPCLEPAISPSGKSGMTLRARRKIMAGEELTMPYTDVLQEVAVREEMMILILMMILRTILILILIFPKPGEARGPGQAVALHLHLCQVWGSLRGRVFLLLLEMWGGRVCWICYQTRGSNLEMFLL